MTRINRENLLTPVSVPCYNCTSENGDSAKKTVIIAPVRIIDLPDGSTQISWACSRGVQCRDKNCRYSHAQPKIEDP